MEKRFTVRELRLSHKEIVEKKRNSAIRKCIKRCRESQNFFENYAYNIVSTELVIREFQKIIEDLHEMLFNWEKAKNKDEFDHYVV